ncbi:hypothetical protein ACUSIJ_27765 [Pseudochelatococcus sp. B33]
MAVAITKDNLFRQVARMSATTKAGMTDLAVRSILDAETSLRDAKTARLRSARLEREAQIAASQQLPKPRSVKARRK